MKTTLPLLLVLGIMFSRAFSKPSLRRLLHSLPSNFYFAQLAPGKEIATGYDDLSSLAKQMGNFMYVIGDKTTGEAAVIDGAWDVDGIFRYLKKNGGNGMNLTRAIATHYHWDHIGGKIPDGWGPSLVVPGIKELSSRGLPVMVPRLELNDAAKIAGLPTHKLSAIDDGDIVQVGQFGVEFIHTPGHSPGSMCVKVTDTSGKGIVLITGDTVFPGSCGRLDLPGSDASVMYDSLRKLSNLPEDLPIFPGHSYSGWGSTVGEEKRTGLLRTMSRSEWNSIWGLREELR